MTNGVEAAEIIKRFVQDQTFGTAIRSMMLILKQFLTQRHLNEVFTGGLSSYALLIMITSFLRLHPKIQSKTIDPMRNLGVLLIEFFELYGKYFNYENVGIAVDLDEAWYFDKRKEGFFYPGKPKSIVVIDPQDPTNDISRGSYSHRLIVVEFGKAYRSLIAMIGAGYVRRGVKQNIKPGKDKFMITILGSILTVNRSVLEHREFIHKRYDEISKGDLASVSPPRRPKPIELQKRKRDEDEIIYIEDSNTDDEVDLFEVDTVGEQSQSVMDVSTSGQTIDTEDLSTSSQTIDTQDISTSSQTIDTRDVSTSSQSPSGSNSGQTQDSPTKSKKKLNPSSNQPRSDPRKRNKQKQNPRGNKWNPNQTSLIRIG